jgi:exopolysaccharide biosynthesis predicted pyruvyltransferase EpsI
MFNLKTSVEAVAAFLGSAETVVTSSYHGAYWASLLGRRVVGIPTSSKFYGLKHAIPLCTIEDWPRFEKLARSYPEALDDCRSANIAFAEKVKDHFFG